MQIRIEFLIQWIDRFEAISLEHLSKGALSHDQTVIQIFQMLILIVELIFWDSIGGMAQDISHFQQIFTKRLDTKLLSIGDLLR